MSGYMVYKLNGRQQFTKKLATLSSLGVYMYLLLLNNVLTIYFKNIQCIYSVYRAVQQHELPLLANANIHKHIHTYIH